MLVEGGSPQGARSDSLDLSALFSIYYFLGEAPFLSPSSCVKYARPKVPLSCPYFSFFFSLSFSAFFFNIFFFSSFCSCVTEPLQPVRITDRGNKNVPTNNLNRLALLNPSPFSRPLRRAAIKYATTSNVSGVITIT